MRYVDLEGNVTVTSDPRTPVFLSYAHDVEAAQRFIQAMLDECFVDGSWSDLRSTAEDQTILAAAFKEVVDAWRERKRWGGVDPAQMMRAFLVAVWHELQNLDDKEWDALTDVANDEVAALSLLCNPYDAVLGDDDRL
jgi:hypothetical protein